MIPVASQRRGGTTEKHTLGLICFVHIFAHLHVLIHFTSLITLPFIIPRLTCLFSSILIVDPISYLILLAYYLSTSRKSRLHHGKRFSGAQRSHGSCQMSGRNEEARSYWVRGVYCLSSIIVLNHYSFGRRIIGLKMGGNGRQYTIHEDLLCANSKLFTRRLQMNRKPIEGDCAVCTERLNKEDDVTFCKNGCGNNFHAYCIDGWKGSQIGPTTCPMCRRTWTRPLKTVEQLGLDVEPRIMQVYLDWLYTGKLQDIEGIDYNAESDDYNIKALEAWAMAEAVEDADFKHAIVADIITKRSHVSSTGFGIESASAAFDLHDSSEMREFTAEAFLVNIDENWFTNGAAFFEPNFRHAVGHAAVRALGKEKPSHRALLEKYTKGTYEMEMEDDAEVNSGNA
jgi:hypothetical protein